MKTFFELLNEAAFGTGESYEESIANTRRWHEDYKKIFQKAADMYAEQSNSHKPVVGGPASASARGAAVGQRSVGTVAEDGDFSCWMSLGGGEQCKELCAECSGELARKSSEGQP